MAQKDYKARHDWVGKVINCDMCKKFKFDHANKWYMHNPAPVQENDTHKTPMGLWYTNGSPLSARRPNLIITNKKMIIRKIFDFAVPADHRTKLNKCEKKNKYLDLARELKNYGIWRWQLYHLWLVLLAR